MHRWWYFEPPLGRCNHPWIFNNKNICWERARDCFLFLDATSRSFKDCCSFKTDEKSFCFWSILISFKLICLLGDFSVSRAVKKVHQLSFNFWLITGKKPSWPKLLLNKEDLKVQVKKLRNLYLFCKSSHATVDFLNKQIGNYSVDGKNEEKYCCSLSFQMRVRHEMKKMLTQMAHSAEPQESKTLEDLKSSSETLVSDFVVANFNRNEKIYRKVFFTTIFFSSFFLLSYLDLLEIFAGWMKKSRKISIAASQ